MIDFNSYNNCNIKTHYNEILNETEQYLYWVTDKLRLSIKERFEKDWGNIILLLASFGKIYILEKIAFQKKYYFEKNISKIRSRIILNWEKYLLDFKEELESELDLQFQKSVLIRFQIQLETKDILYEFHDFEVFLNERDTIELFFLGNKLFFKSKSDYSKIIFGFDNKIKKIILNEIKSHLVNEYPLELLKSLNKEFLPDNFWWRHIGW